MSAPLVPPIAVLPIARVPIAVELLAQGAVVTLTNAPRGPAGRDGDGTVFEFVQSSPSALWTVNHNLGRKPAAVTVLSPGGLEVTAAVTNLSENQLQIAFSAPRSGTAHIL